MSISFIDAMRQYFGIVDQEKTAQTIKAHSTTAVTTPTTNAWTDCDNLVEVASECSGDMLELQADGKTIKALKKGLFHFGGCLHYQNNSGNNIAPLVGCRIFINGMQEAKCSQRVEDKDQRNSGESAISYNGTMSLDADDTFVLQYYTNTNLIDFDSNAIFAEQVAWTIWATFIGQKG